MLMLTVTALADVANRPRATSVNNDARSFLYAISSLS
jgi:hypothetical protein